MKLVLAEEMGMCFGVRDALTVVRNIEEPENFAINGQLVHNEVVLSELTSRGFTMLPEEDRQGTGNKKSLIITAHGVSNRERSRLIAQVSHLVDTTCPLVKRAHDAAIQLQSEGRFIIVIGSPNHVEVRGLTGDLVDYVVVKDVQSVGKYGKPKIGVISQTTVSPYLAKEIRDQIDFLNCESDIRHVDTICHPTRKRQRALQRLINRVDLIIVIGGANSNNTRELMELCLKNDVMVHRVSQSSELRREWLHDYDRIGLTAGTSTPDERIHQVASELKYWIDSEQISNSTENSRAWCNHFRRNVRNQLDISWSKGHGLTQDEIAILIPSLQDFQLGESSEGIHGRSRATAYANKIGDEFYSEAIRLFFQEENRHASYLGRFIAMTGSTTIQKSWTDFIFRRVRRLLGLEMLIVVLVTAELIGEVFYRAIYAANQSVLLRQICAQLLRDEKQHIRFHIERFRLIDHERSRIVIGLRNLSWRVFLTFTLFAVWMKHRRAFRLGGRSFGRFWKESWDGWSRLMIAIKL